MLGDVRRSGASKGVRQAGHWLCQHHQSTCPRAMAPQPVLPTPFPTFSWPPSNMGPHFVATTTPPRRPASALPAPCAHERAGSVRVQEGQGALTHALGAQWTPAPAQQQAADRCPQRAAPLTQHLLPSERAIEVASIQQSDPQIQRSVDHRHRLLLRQPLGVVEAACGKRGRQGEVRRCSSRCGEMKKRRVPHAAAGFCCSGSVNLLLPSATHRQGPGTCSPGQWPRPRSPARPACASAAAWGGAVHGREAGRGGGRQRFRAAKQCIPSGGESPSGQALRGHQVWRQRQRVAAAPAAPAVAAGALAAQPTASRVVDQLQQGTAMASKRAGDHAGNCQTLGAGGRGHGWVRGPCD